VIREPTFTVVHREEMERDGAWSLARRSLGLRAFGLNLVEIEPGGRIPEHTEVARDQEEVFVVLSGAPTMVVDGRPIPLSAGCFVRLDPEPARYVRNDGAEPATVLIASAPRTSGYQPMAWA
jgi:quercetin dioxygenase-like cupin family protein